MRKTKTTETVVADQNGDRDELDINLLSSSRYLRKEDCDPPLTPTMDHVERELVVDDEKWVLYFKEIKKGLVLGPMKGKAIAEANGIRNMADWGGHKIVLFHDRTIMCRGKRTGGIGIRKYVPPVRKPHRPVRMSEPRADEPEYSEARPTVTGSELTPEQEAEINALLR